jgi:lipopolysaccharide biosynthesis glycosyltransferase
MEINSGVIMFNCGTKCLIRAIVCLYSLRKYYDGDVTFFLEESSTPKEFDEVCKYFNVNIVKLPDDPGVGALIKKTKTLWNTPYDKTLWLDADIVITGKIDEMFSYLDDTHTFAIPNFCRWKSNGHHVGKRVKRFKDIVSKEILDEALNNHPAINTGIFSYKKQTKFLKDWIDLSIKTIGKHIFIGDEIACQVLMPQFKDEIYIADPKFNVSVLYGNDIEDKRAIHYHGNKPVLSVPLCEIFKQTFREMCDKNTANINFFLKYADSRLGEYLKKIHDPNFVDTTIVTAIDNYYIDILRVTWNNWRKYKHIDKYPVIIFVNGLELTDTRLDFLRLPNVQLIPWSKEKDLDNVTEHREEMLSCFIIGAAKYVKTEYWLKLDADSFATDGRDFIDDKMRQFAFFGHKWSYSRPKHIETLDTWSKGHWKRKLKFAKPMINEGRIEGNRFYHNTKRTISYIQLHKTKFTKFCVSLFRERRLPCPSQDTTMFYIANRFNPETVGIGNFKKNHGFTQGRGKLGADHIKKCVEEVDRKNAEKETKAKEINNINSHINSSDSSNI